MANLYKLAMKDLPTKSQIINSGSTNQIVYSQSGQTLKLYIPGFISITFNGIYGVDQQNMKSQIHCEVKLMLNVKQLASDEQIVKHIKNNVYLYSSVESPLHLNEQDETLELQIQEDHQDQDYGNIKKAKYHYIKFILQKTFTTGLVIDAFWTPFDLMGLTLTLNPKINTNYIVKSSSSVSQLFDHRIKNIQFHINLMHTLKGTRDSIKYQTGYKFSIYGAATSKFQVEYSNQVSSQKQIQRSLAINTPDEDAIKQAADYSLIKEFQYAHFYICLYKNPGSAVTTIFVPLILLSIINLGIFSQTNSLAGRIENIAGLMFAFMEIYPIIRNQIPPTPDPTLAQFHIFLITVTTLLCLIKSIIFRGDGEAVNVWQDPFFIASLVATVYVFLAITILMIIHFCYWEQLYNIKEKNEDEKHNSQNHKYWKNDFCNRHFMKFFDNQTVRPFPCLVSEKLYEE